MTQTVSDSQVLDVSPLVAGSLPLRELDDEISETFFADGRRQEARGDFVESAQIPIKSLDRVPRRWWSVLLLLFIMLAMSGGAAWMIGLRPPQEWQDSRVWRTLRLPKMEPPADPLLKLW